MKEALILLFLIVAYNFLLWYITVFDLSPIPLFPETPEHTVLVLSYTSVLYVSWLFGEREKVVQWIGYLFFIQIVALSIYFEDLSIIVRDLPPVILTFAIVVLFESPKEKQLRAIEEERESLLQELDKVREEREKVDIHLRLLTMKIRELEQKRKEVRKEEEDIKLKEEIEKLKRELEEYKQKEERLLETNRRLFELLDTLRTSSERSSKKSELSNLRKERKKLIKEVIQLQELANMYSEENEKLREEKEALEKKVEELTRELNKVKVELENIRDHRDEKAVLSEFIRDTFLTISVSDRVLKDLLSMKKQERVKILREMLKIDSKKVKKFEPLSTASDIYKYRFSGGRIYLKRKDGSWEVVGVITSEDDKTKERYINEILSEISERI